MQKVPSGAAAAGGAVESPYTKLCKKALHSTFCTLDGKGASGGDKYCPAYVDKRDDDPRQRVVDEEPEKESKTYVLGAPYVFHAAFNATLPEAPVLGEAVTIEQLYKLDDAAAARAAKVLANKGKVPNLMSVSSGGGGTKKKKTSAKKKKGGKGKKKR